MISYGNILSNIGSALVGGPGVVPGCNIGREYALFEPGCRHVAKDIMGQNIANPTAMVLSSSLMLRHLGYVGFLLDTRLLRRHRADDFFLSYLNTDSSRRPTPSPVPSTMSCTSSLPYLASPFRVALPLTLPSHFFGLQPRGQGPHWRHGRPGLDLGLHQRHHLQDLKESSFPPSPLLFLSTSRNTPCAYSLALKEGGYSMHIRPLARACSKGKVMETYVQEEEGGVKGWT